MPLPPHPAGHLPPPQPPPRTLVPPPAPSAVLFLCSVSQMSRATCGTKVPTGLYQGVHSASLRQSLWHVPGPPRRPQGDRAAPSCPVFLVSHSPQPRPRALCLLCTDSNSVSGPNFRILTARVTGQTHGGKVLRGHPGAAAQAPHSSRGRRLNARQQRLCLQKEKGVSGKRGGKELNFS